MRKNPVLIIEQDDDKRGISNQGEYAILSSIEAKKDSNKNRGINNKNAVAIYSQQLSPLKHNKGNISRGMQDFTSREGSQGRIARQKSNNNDLR